MTTHPAQPSTVCRAHKTRYVVVDKGYHVVCACGCVSDKVHTNWPGLPLVPGRCDNERDEEIAAQ